MIMSETTLVLHDALKLLRDIGNGKYSGDRGTSALSAMVAMPVVEALADADLSNPISVRDVRETLLVLHASEPEIMGHYPHLKRFVLKG